MCLYFLFSHFAYRSEAEAKFGEEMEKNRAALDNLRKQNKITENEFIDTDENYGRDFVDHRRNHMSSVNHKIFYENIEKIIKNDYRLLPFAKNIDYIKNFGELRDTKLGKFIYE